MTLLTGGYYGQQPRKRRVFFSFYYQDDIWRVNQVRNSWRYGYEGEREAEGFYDGSIWERSKRESDDSLKALIRESIQNTSVTVVLVGTYTYQRRWVRYEVARSIIKGNGLLAAKIHGLRNQQQQTSQPGSNPLDHMGVYRDGARFLLAETDDQGRWIRYEDFTQAVTLPAGWQQPTTNVPIALSHYGRIHDYAYEAGQNNFPSWVATAAMEAGR